MSDDLAHCAECSRPWVRVVLDDAGLCSMCRMPVMVMPHNPFLPSPATGYTLSPIFALRPGWWPPKVC